MANRLIRALLARMPPSLVRSAGHWLRSGRRRRWLFAPINRSLRSAPARISHGPLQGLMFAGGETAGYSLGASEPDVQRALIEYLQPGDVFYDVGANAGFHSLLGAKLVGPEGRVYCFEPLPKAVSVLRHNLDENGYANYEIIEAAVGESSGTARLTGPPGQLRAKLNEGAKSFLEVQLVSLDELGFRTPKLVKIDVEGAEKRVLEGMRSIMHEHRPVLVIEIHGLERPSVERILQESGYAFSVLNEDGMLHLIATGSAEASARRHPARDDSQA